MASLRDLKSKINATKKTRQITNAMHMVAAANLNRSQLQAEAYQEYMNKLRSVVAHIASGNKGSLRHPMLETRPVKKVGYIVIAGERGLAGAYNNNVFKALEALIKDKNQSKDDYTGLVVGRMAQRYFEKRQMPVSSQAVGIPDQPSFESIKALAKDAVRLFENQEIDELHIIYTHFVSAISQQVRTVQLLPLTDVESGGDHKTYYEYEPSENEVLETLLPQYIEGYIYGALLDAKAAEHAARMTAMKNSTDNASEMIERYTLQYNRARQAAITQEISEIVGGANALQ
ncbi:ATP synthase F1 subunit gamma [Tuberibacillus calidus]|uniref:ATP synthase F1 subunit gamma n=1 Tax=Tuberibacillus calidus TaxID=340097 RepID=UPI0004268BC7|nr:ATP synthase F1 subunit gamma [Tuberibacillus calidus]